MKRSKQTTVFSLLLLLFLLPIVVDEPYVLHLTIMSLMWAVMALSWDVLLEYARIFSLGHLAFFAIGAYTSAMLAIYLGLSPWIGMIAGGGAAAIISVAIGLPCLRLRGIYIALFTIAFQEILRALIVTGREWTGGYVGLPAIPQFQLGGLEFGAVSKIPYYYLALTIFLISTFAMYRILHSRIGLAFVALRDSEEYALSVGVDPFKYKLLAFALTAFFAGLVGSFYTHYIAVLSPSDILSFGLMLQLLLMIMIGGRDKLYGPALGAFTIVFLSELLHIAEEYRLLILGLTLLVLVILLPSGLAGLLSFKKRKR